MKNFAKLYDTTIGQIVVMRQPGDEGPELAFYFKPEGYGTCTVSLGFEDSEEGEAKADAALDMVTEEVAVSNVQRFFNNALPGSEL